MLDSLCSSKCASRKTVAAAVALVFYMPTAAVAQNNVCETIAKGGLYDVSSHYGNTEQVRSHAFWYCDEQFQSSSEADEFGVDALVPFEGVPVKLGFDKNRESFSEFNQRVCAEGSDFMENKNEYRSFVKTFSPVAASLLKDCIEEHAGVHAWVQRSPIRKEFFVSLKWNKFAGDDPSTIDLKAVDIPDNVQCDPALKSGLEVRLETDRYRCKRTNDEAVAINISASKPIIGNEGLLTLGTIFRPEPTLPCERLLASASDDFLISGVPFPGNGNGGAGRTRWRLSDAKLLVDNECNARFSGITAAMDAHTFYPDANGPHVEVALTGEDGVVISDFFYVGIGSVPHCGGYGRLDASIPFPFSDLRKAEGIELKFTGAAHQGC